MLVQALKRKSHSGQTRVLLGFSYGDLNHGLNPSGIVQSNT